MFLIKRQNQLEPEPETRAIKSLTGNKSCDVSYPTSGEEFSHFRDKTLFIFTFK